VREESGSTQPNRKLIIDVLGGHLEKDSVIVAANSAAEGNI
jgi:hypothetical protein